MSSNCFLRQEASSDIIRNVTNFCADCYGSISQNDIIFYDMQKYRYLCQACLEKIQENLDNNCEPLIIEKKSLF